MNSFKTLKLERADGIATLTFTRQQTLNSLSLQSFDDLSAVLDQLAQDSQTRVVILTGAGRSFCSGLDLNLLGQIGSTIQLEELRGIMQHWQNVFTSLENLPQVTIVGINGICLGGGVEMILACDFRIASTRAIFGLPEVKLGIIPDLGGITRLTRVVGPARAKEIILRGRNVNAIEALRLGLLNRVAEPGDMMGVVRNWAAQFAKLPLPAVKAAKCLINSAFDVDQARALKDAQEAQLELLASEEFRAALNQAREERGVAVGD